MSDDETFNDAILLPTSGDIDGGIANIDQHQSLENNISGMVTIDDGLRVYCNYSIDNVYSLQPMRSSNLSMNTATSQITSEHFIAIS